MEHKIEMQKREVFTAAPLTVREVNDENPVIEGVAIVCDKETVLYECNDFREIEIIDKSCLNRSWDELFINDIHDRARTFGQIGHNLSVEPREDGLHFSVWGTSNLFREVYDLCKDGVRNGCSFEFYPKDYTVEEREGADGKTEYVIRHTEFAAVTALTIAMQPAYKQTSVNARELYREAHPDVMMTEEEKAKVKDVEPGVGEREAEAERVYLQRENARRARELNKIKLQTT